jgi:hypothetical protein
MMTQDYTATQGFANALTLRVYQHIMHDPRLSTFLEERVQGEKAPARFLRGFFEDELVSGKPALEGLLLRYVLDAVRFDQIAEVLGPEEEPSEEHA